MKKSIDKIQIVRYLKNDISEKNDFISVEEPLEITVAYGSAAHRQRKNISVTMRTPDNNDFELAMGFLYSEGLILKKNDVLSVRYIDSTNENRVQVELNAQVVLDTERLERHFYAASSCGICGKSSIEMIQNNSSFVILPDHFFISKEILYTLPAQLRKVQQQFERTGGLHASALFNDKGEILLLKEDVGRHNALDKIIGWAFQNQQLPLQNHLLLVSGRLSFELVQKAWMAGISMIAAIGAPSSLALQLAEEVGITIIGFLKEDSFNVYVAPSRVV
jgi:FdhD protein